MAEKLEIVLEALHDSEINGEVSWFFGAGWIAALGDPIHGIEAEESFDRIGDAVGWLVDKAAELYPDSAFARQFVRPSPLRPFHLAYQKRAS
jgi:hypothetical protein